MTSRKSHLSAVALLLNDADAGPVQAIRRVHDRQVGRWPPHVNLLYPFLAGDHGAALSTACRGLRALPLRLSTFRWFVHPTGTATVWLEPEPAEAVRDLQARLQAAFPECDDVSRHLSGFTPHLSVGQARSEEAARELAASLQAEWRPVVVRVEHVALLRREADGPFREERRIRLTN